MFKWYKKFSRFDHNVYKSRLVNTSIASFVVILGQMTEMTLRKQQLCSLQLLLSVSIVVLSLFFFSAVTSAFQLFTRKLCLQFSRLRMRNFTWNRFPIKNLQIDSLLTPIVESTFLLLSVMNSFLFGHWEMKNVNFFWKT